MKFPSLKNLADSALVTIRRFPFEVLFALAGTIAATIKVELTRLNRVDESWCTRSIMIANLGLLLSLSATLFAESKSIRGSRKMFIRLAAAAISLALIFAINPATQAADYVRFLLFSLGFHLLVAFAGFTVPGHIQGFWQFNKALFLRFLTSALYSAVLFAGLAAAIGAMNFLFNFKFEWDTFSILWIWIVGMFSTVFFLAGVPPHLQELDQDFSYPKGLKVFTQYVLIPLATVYVAILLAYEVKILIQWSLPKGLVSNLILGYAVFGILSLLLVYPIRDKEENRWLKTYSRSFYFLLIPLLGLLFTAMGTRIFHYGITEKRYFLLLLACWLLSITVYFLFTKKQNIKLIPISLSILTLLSIYGPQSAFSVSEFSQQRVLVAVFKKNNAYQNGKLMPVSSQKVSREDGRHAVATLYYLITNHDLASLQPYFNDDLNKVSDSLSAIKPKGENRLMTDYQLQYEKLEWAKKRLNLTRFDRFETDPDVIVNPNFTLHTSDGNAAVVKGYDYLLDEETSTDTVTYQVDGITVRRIKNSTGRYMLKLDSSLITFDLKPELDKLTQPAALDNYKQDGHDYANFYTVPAKSMMFTSENDQLKVVLLVERIVFQKDEKKQWDINFMTGRYLIRKK
ncbi:DUF4153 domain-containing protein [Mucilaginibacter sp.]|uniref:DUF4153 domain-containing protein n=1 Tax=Mucilaginibacter sp. TaxID=1882438 RepID=UPI0035BBCA01